MGRLTAFFALLFLAWPVAAQDLPARPRTAAVRSVTTNNFGVTVSDPYRYMENLGDPAVTAWINGQGRYARSLLDSIPGRMDILAELKAIEKAEPAKIGRVVVMPGHRYFYLRQETGKGFYNLYRRDGLSGKQVLLVDPNQGRLDGAADLTIASFSPSFDGSYLAYAVSAAGTGNLTLRVLNADTGKTVADTIAGVERPAVAWLPDGHSFLYVRREKAKPGSTGESAGEGSRVYLHRLGADFASDTAVFGAAMAPGPKAAAGDVVSVETAPGSSYAVVARKEAGNGSLRLYAAPLAKMGKAPVQWIRIGNDDVTIVDYRLRGNELFLLVDGLNGPLISMVSLQNPAVNGWGMMLQLSPEENITGMQAAADALYLTLVSGGNQSLVRLPYNPSAEILKEGLPFRAGVRLYDEDPRVDGALVTLSSWTRAPAIYRYKPGSDKVERTGLWPSGPYDDPSEIASASVTALGSDGTLVPLTILYKKGTQADGTHPTLLVGYGAFSYTRFAVFHPSWLVWLDRGGILAFARPALPTRFQDFLTCARYLIDQGYTTPERLAAIGGRAGAILVGRAMTTNPELFRAVVIQSGLLDTLRPENTSSGVSDGRVWGNTKTLKGFRGLESLSSYNHVEPNVRYPAVLLETGMNDPRVPAWQSAKMAARLDADSTSGLPVLLNVQNGPGQAFEAGLARKRDLFADETSFLLWQLGAPGFQPQQPAAATAAR